MDQTSHSAALKHDQEVELIHWLHDVGRLIKSANSRYRAEHSAPDEIAQQGRPEVAAAVRERAVAAVLFADIVGSTEKAVQIGDAAWRDLLAEFGMRFSGLSPDGNLVAYVWNGPKQENDDIYVQQIGGRRPIRLTQNEANDSEPSFSPDGARIARQVGGNLLPRIETGPPRRTLACLHARSLLHGPPKRPPP